MRVIVCGGRDFSDSQHLLNTLNRIHSETPITEVIEGDARGADKMAGDWARLRGISLTVVPADWNKYGKSAGYKRNVAMADLKPDAVVAFAGGVGTNMMKRIANERFIKVIEV